ncbi:hypothetical protein IAT38_002586 [Cryptococcus sp. DSM 104549]
MSLLQRWVPGIKLPVVCNGPMIGAACPALAVAVTKAGGLGFIESTTDIASGSSQLTKLASDLSECRTLLGTTAPPSAAPLPVGISFITGHKSINSFASTVVPLVTEHRPAAVWLFAPNYESGDHPHGQVIDALRRIDSGGGSSKRPAVFVQVGNLSAAREAASHGADVIVCQGIDAGGHQFRAGSGVISLVPAVKRMLAREFPGAEIVVLAAGGIVSAEGAAGALALGAQGVVMGTRFTVAYESKYPDHRKEKVLAASDGSLETWKSPFHDEVRNSSLWGKLYDGRAIISPVHEKFMAGASLSECQRDLEEKYTPEEANKVISTWAGTGVGLVEKAEPAGDMVRDVREGAVQIIKRLAESVNAKL